MRQPEDVPTAAVVLFAGAVLATVGNALHPLFEAGVSVESFLEAVEGHGSWQLLHLTIAVGVVLLAAGIVTVCGDLADTAGSSLAALASTLGAVGASIFAIQIGGIDGVVMPRLAEAYASGENPEAVLAAATGMYALDLALLALVVTIYVGGLFLAFGLALTRADAFAPWVRWLATATGATGVVIGPMMFLNLADGFTFIAFRVIALGATVVAFAVATQQVRGTTGIPTTTAPPTTTTG